MQRIYINCFFSFLLLTISFVAQGQDEDFALNFIDNSSVKELAYPACASHNVDLRACRPSICQQQTKLGRVYRKVVKKDDKDNCLYQERIENYGNMECTFKQEDLEIAQAVMDYHLSDETQDLDVMSASNLLASACKLSTTGNSAMLITLEPDEESRAENSDQRKPIKSLMLKSSDYEKLKNE
jgi:hypothetical protein